MDKTVPWGEVLTTKSGKEPGWHQHQSVLPDCGRRVVSCLPPLPLTARYSWLYSSSCEPKHTFLLFRGLCQVIWSHEKENNGLFIGRSSVVGNMHHYSHRVRHAMFSLHLYIFYFHLFVWLCFFSPAKESGSLQTPTPLSLSWVLRSFRHVSCAEDGTVWL